MKLSLLVAAVVLVLSGIVAWTGEPTPVKPDEKTRPDAAAPNADKDEIVTPAVAKANDALKTERASLEKAVKEAQEAAKKEQAAIEEAQKIKEIEAQTELIRVLRKAAEYQKAESERRAQRALQQPDEKKKKIQEILDIIQK